MKIYGVDLTRIKSISVEKPQRGETSLFFYPPYTRSPECGYWRKEIRQNYLNELLEEDYYTPSEVKEAIEKIIQALQQKPFDNPPLRVTIYTDDEKIIIGNY